MKTRTEQEINSELIGKKFQMEHNGEILTFTIEASTQAHKKEDFPRGYEYIQVTDLFAVNERPSRVKEGETARLRVSLTHNAQLKHDIMTAFGIRFYVDGAWQQIFEKNSNPDRIKLLE